MQPIPAFRNPNNDRVHLMGCQSLRAQGIDPSSYERISLSDIDAVKACKYCVDIYNDHVAASGTQIPSDGGRFTVEGVARKVEGVAHTVEGVARTAEAARDTVRSAGEVLAGAKKARAYIDELRASKAHRPVVGDSENAAAEAAPTAPLGATSTPDGDHSGRSPSPSHARRTRGQTH